MTGLTPPIPDSDDWQLLLSESVRTSRELLDFLKIDPAQVAVLPEAQLDFPCRVPQPFMERMQPGNPEDPLLLQVLPLANEAAEVPGYVADPLQEAGATPAAGIIHKYNGRVLLVAAGACAVNCRYCFRRHFPYQDHLLDRFRLNQSVDYIRSEATISEVILSGGDPLVLSDRRLYDIVCRLDKIPHLRRLRIHTRLPVVLPQRVTPALTGLLESTRLNVVVVIHSNHANELDDEVGTGLAQLRGAGITLLNQSVLLRGVNDDAASLALLSETLFSRGVLPYYLHLLDPVAGSAHFHVPEVKARELYAAVLNRLPGYLVPRLVREEPGKGSKSLLLPACS
ncbi:MAG: EF-P beta-lysylation protein EpmB [Gammaproteobacteria bacterium]|nr:EF-P beta-lysylation protein EpmB [Gammaproteobacteria bacterium]